MTAGATRDGSVPSRQWVRRNTQILDAVELLLTDRALRDLSVDDIARAAGITRTRFYVYYPSKYEAYAAVLARLSEIVLASYQLPGSWFQRPADLRPRDSLVLTFRTVVPLWWQHRAVLREASDLWNTTPGRPNQWRTVMAEFSRWTARAIERERRLGIAPPGADPTQLAEFLMWQTERILHLRTLDDREPDDTMADTAVQIWMRSIYLTDDPDAAVTDL